MLNGSYKMLGIDNVLCIKPVEVNEQSTACVYRYARSFNLSTNEPACNIFSGEYAIFLHKI